MRVLLERLAWLLRPGASTQNGLEVLVSTFGQLIRKEPFKLSGSRIWGSTSGNGSSKSITFLRVPELLAEVHLARKS